MATVKIRLPRRAQLGFALVELMVALVVLMVLAVVGMKMVQDATRRSDAAATGDWMRVVANAAKAYQKANAAALLAAAGPTTPATASAVQLASLLPPGFSSTGPQGHSFSVRWIEPTPGKLEGLVVLQGGEALSGMSLVQVAGQAGGGAGYVDPTNAAQGKGPRGVWEINLASFGGTPGAGRPLYALFYDTEIGSSTNDYLNRTSVAGKPELNRMSTAIDMNDNAIANARTVDATAGIRANQISIGKSDFGATPYPYETIQLNNGNNLRFAIGTREHAVFGSDGATQFRGAVHAQSASIGGNVTAGSVSAGDITANNLTAYSAVQGNEVWANGWFRSRGTGGWYSEAYGGGWHMSDPTWIRAYNGKSVYTSGELRGGSVSSEGAITAGGRVTGNDLFLNRVETQGAWCGETGLTARSSDGKMLSCTSGAWRAPGGITTTVITGYLSPGCSQSSYAACPAGTAVVGGGSLWVQNCGGKEQYQFHSINRPNGNSWEARVEQANSIAYAICAY